MIKALVYRDSLEEIEIDEVKKITEIYSGEGFYWFDLEKPRRRDLMFLAGIFSFHVSSYKDVHRFREMPKMVTFNDYSMLALFAVRPTEQDVTFPSIALFVGQNYIITIRYERIHNLKKSWRKCLRNSEIFAGGVESILYRVLEDLLHGYYLPIKEWEQKIRILEDETLVEASPDILPRLIKLRRTLLQFSYCLTPLAEILDRLVNAPLTFVGSKRDFSPVYDNLRWLESRAATNLKLANSLFDAYFSTVSNRQSAQANLLNSVMARLTIVTLIFLPLTFLTSLYGMNFSNMPELKWHYGYYVLWGIMLFIAGGMIFYFYRKGWMK